MSVHPFVHVSSRFYYNMDRRSQKGRKTDCNSADFFAISIEHAFQPIISVRSNGCGLTSIVPHWGLRRVFGDKFLLEFALGVNFNRNTRGVVDYDPSINLRLGYVFNYK